MTRFEHFESHITPVPGSISKEAQKKGNEKLTESTELSSTSHHSTVHMYSSKWGVHVTYSCTYSNCTVQLQVVMGIGHENKVSSVTVMERKKFCGHWSNYGHTVSYVESIVCTYRITILHSNYM